MRCATSGRRVDPWVVLPVLVAQLPNADADAPAPSAMPEVREVRGEVAREEILMRSRKHRHAAAGRLRRQRAVTDFHGLALGLQPVVHFALQYARGVVVRDLRLHVVAGCAIGRGRHVEAGVVVVRDVRIVGREHSLLVDKAAAGIKRIRDRRLRSCPCAGRRSAARRGRRWSALLRARSVNVPLTTFVPSGCAVGSSKNAFHPPRRLPVSPR